MDDDTPTRPEQGDDAGEPGEPVTTGVDVPSGPRPRWWLVAVGALAVLVLVVWWWWPALTRDSDRTDVIVVGRGQVVQADEAIQRRIREEGMSVEVVNDRGAPCQLGDHLAEAIDDADPSVVVLSPSGSDDCAGRWPETLAAVGDRMAIVLVQPGTLDAASRAEIDATGVVVADPTRLLGDATVTRRSCLWWDDCEPDGQVAVRNADGSLTDAGAQRVARVLAGTIP